MKVLCLDTETTGFLKNNVPIEDQPHLVQFGAILRGDDGRELGVVSKIIEPDGYEIPERATAIHGITTEMAQDMGFPARNVVEDVEALVNMADLVVGHNLQFDVKIINLAFRHLGMTCPRWGMPLYCTMHETTPILKLPGRYPGQYKWPKLAEAYKYFTGHDMEDAHDALGDVRATLVVYDHLVGNGGE